MRKIVTSYVRPPIYDPMHSMDWCAYFDGEEEAGGYGYGATEIEAIADFLTEAVADECVSEAEALVLSAAAGIKPTCDEAGNWRYVPAASIDGPRAPVRIGSRFFRLMPPAAPWCASEFVEITPDEIARAAVEGAEAKPITQERAA